MEKFASPGDKDYRIALRHTAAHIMAQAVLRIYPDAKLTVGPANDEGFFYDIDLNGKTLAPEDLQKIEDAMKKISKENFPLKYSEQSRSEAKSFLTKSNQPYKVELVDMIPADEPVSFYTQGEFIDLCEGPHVRHTGELKHFKLLTTSGAYWKGDQNNPMIQRIYGTAFETKEALDAHLLMLEEAKKRDHRELGKKLDLFSMHPYAPGSPFFHPKGTLVYNAMIDFIRELYRERGYQEVLTPQVYDVKLYETSGHRQSFWDNMFRFEDEEGHIDCLKPMNCPGHCLFYKGQLYSYRDLPLRIAEFTRLHRNEKSGTLHGITRVRALAQDDAHVFCTNDQIEAETDHFFDFVDAVYKAFGFKNYSVRLATRPENKIGSDAEWDRTEGILEGILKKRKIPYEIAPGEGAFYGPKYEFHIKDAIGRSWQLATLQLDPNLPERFELEYVGQDGKRHRPVMIHRAILGSLERFFGVYLEHCEGYFPTWLAPVQFYIVPVKESHQEFARQLEARLNSHGLRAFADCREGNMGGKVREATVQRVPYIAVVGDKEIGAQSVALKSPKFGDFGLQPVESVERILLAEVKSRSVDTLFKK